MLGLDHVTRSISSMFAFWVTLQYGVNAAHICLLRKGRCPAPQSAQPLLHEVMPSVLRRLGEFDTVNLVI